jgi:glycine/sarcosine N-methyltransferase
MTDETHIEHGVADFYDALAPNYDSMTGFEKRFAAEQPHFRSLIERYGIASALDAGCGTGFHSLLLSRLGVSVTAVDVSTEMLARLQRHADELNAIIETVQSDFQTLASVVHKHFDAVFCLGNSLAHLLTSDDLRATLTCFASLLNPNGILFIQILNYDRILAQRERVQNVKEVGNTTFVRFYDFEKEFLRFNILKLEKKGGVTEQSMNSVQLRPIRHEEFLRLLRECGFNGVQTYGAISLEEFLPEKSKDVFVIARKRN